MTKDADPFCVDFWLLFQKGDASTATNGQQKPVVIASRRKMVDCVVLRQQVGVPTDVVLSGIDGSPVRIRIIRLSILHRSSAPVNGQRRIAALGVPLYNLQKCPLTATVHVHYRRHTLCACRKPIERRHPGRLPSERPYVVDDIPQREALFLPLTHDLHLKRLDLWIVPCPEFFNVLRRLGQRRQRISAECRNIRRNRNQSCKQSLHWFCSSCIQCWLRHGRQFRSDNALSRKQLTRA